MDPADEPLFEPCGAPREAAICRRFGGRILAYGLCHLRDRQAAMDLVQHVLLAVLQSLRDDRVEDRSKLDAYVLGTCRYAVRDLRRGELRDRRIAGASADVLPASYEPSFAGVDRLRLEGCIARLEPRARAVVLESFVEDRSAEEIAEAMSTTAGNVRVLRHRALAALRDCVEGRRR